MREKLGNFVPVALVVSFGAGSFAWHFTGETEKQSHAR